MLHTQKFTLPRLIGLLPFVGLLLILMGPSVAHAAGGTVWASRTSAADNNWRSVTYGNGLFVAVSATGAGNRVMTSPDGIIWTIRTFSRALFNAVFPHPNWEINAADYASDFHPVDLKAQSWSFEVRAKPVGSKVFLSWEGSPELLKRSQLIEVATGKIILPTDPLLTMKGSDYP